MDLVFSCKMNIQNSAQLFYLKIFFFTYLYVNYINVVVNILSNICDLDNCERQQQTLYFYEYIDSFDIDIDSFFLKKKKKEKKTRRVTKCNMFSHHTLEIFKTKKKNTSGHKVWYAFTLYIDNDASANQNALTYEHGKNISR